MQVSEALKQRKSVRAYLDKPVERSVIEDILNSAKHAPSGGNMQPWEVVVVSGNKKQEVDDLLTRCFDESQPEALDYQYYPKSWWEPFKSRRKETGLLMYETLEIQREEVEKQRHQWRQNFLAFNAPVVMFVFMDKSLEAGSYMDVGMFIQSVLLMATEKGLGSCPQAALASYPDVVREAVGMSSDKFLLCGIGLGYEDKAHKVNSYRTSRLELDGFSTFLD